MANGSACAACRHRRKRCDPNCLLAPYFPQDKMDDFLNVHKVFGVSNVVEILSLVNDEEEKHKAAETIMLEAKIRRDNPVYGSYVVRMQLQAEIDACQKELILVQDQLRLWKSITEMEKQRERLEAQLDMCPLSLNSTTSSCWKSW